MLPLLASLAVFAPQGPGTSPAPVVINEFLYDDSSTDDKEFVELYNRTAVAIDIGDWTIVADDPTTTNPAYVIPTGTILPPGGYYVVGAGTVPGVNLTVGTSNLWENDNESLELMDNSGRVVDSVAYEIARGTWGPHPREGAGIVGEIVTVDANPQTWQRRVDGYDTDDNGCDFCVMMWTPGAANGSANTLPSGHRNDFDAAPGTGFAGEFNYAFVAPNAQDPAAVTNAVVGGVPNLIAIPPSPQGGNVGVFHDPTGGGNASYLKVGASEQFLLECHVFVRGGNAAFAAPAPGTGEGEAWAIGVTGATDGAAHPPDVAGYHAQIQCTGMRPGATGIGWFAYVQQTQTSIYLVDMDHGGPGFSVIAGPVVATPGVNDGWQRLRLRIDGGDLVANFGGTFGCDDGIRFTAAGVGNCGGTVYFQYRECIVDNTQMTPLIVDRLEVQGITAHAVTFGGAASPTTFATPMIATSGGDPVVGNATFGIAGSGLVPGAFSVLLLGLGGLDPGVPVAGAPPAALLYVNPVLATVLTMNSVAGTTGYALPIPCVNELAGLPVATQYVDFDPALPVAVPIGTSVGMHVLVGN